ncbi:MAG: FAD binding domain-containing protein [SAR324 cluster bacterium]|jgi:4-hydroxybenzoyl-CoA reductase subunit beta|nr:FAD binding domain-containing protein [SAR324 cluster bacterium]
MLRLPPFDYHAPKSVAEAVALKAECGETAMYSAGGTDLFPNMKRRQFTPQTLIGLRDLAELQKIESADGMRIGSGVSLNQVAEHPEIIKRFPALAKAAALVSAPQLRNMGTIGGNLCLDTRCNYYNQTFPWRKALGFCLKKDGDICWVALSSPKCLAVSSSDCAPVAMALNAEFYLVAQDGERTVPAAEFYKNDGADFLNKTPDELLVSIRLPAHEGWRMNYKKLRRRDSIDFPILGVATALRLEKSGRSGAAASSGTVGSSSIAGECAEIRIVLGAVASSPLRAYEAEKMLIGERLTTERIEAAAHVAAKLAKPLDNTDMTLGFRKKMVSRFVADAIKEALEN